MSNSTITTSINAHVGANYSTTSVAYPNVEFDTLSVSEFVRVNIIFGSSSQRTMGGSGNIYRQLGRVVFQIFTEVDTGSLRSANIADELSTLVRSKVINTIQFSTPETRVFGNTDGFYLETVAVDFYDDEIITVPL